MEERGKWLRSNKNNSNNMKQRKQAKVELKECIVSKTHPKAFFLKSAINTEKKKNNIRDTRSRRGWKQTRKRMNKWLNVCEYSACTESLYLCFPATVQCPLFGPGIETVAG